MSEPTAAAAHMRELLGMLFGGPLAVRKGACETVLGLTGTAEGLALVSQCSGIPALARLIGDASPLLGELAVKCLINVSADAEHCSAVCASAGVVAGCMDCLRDADCPYRHPCLMLLCNVASTDAGCARIMQVPDSPTAPPASCQGLHLRRLIQLFLQPPPAAARSAGAAALPAAQPTSDVFEYAGSVLASVSARADARALLLEPDRRILPVLFPQLCAPSLVRRRGVAATLRNACFETSPAALAYMLSPSVDLPTALLAPLAGQAKYTAEEAQGMHASLAGAGAGKARESDPTVRQSLVEGLSLLCASRQGRDHLRAAKAYYVVRAFHWWLEGVDDSSSSPEEEGGGAGNYMVTTQGAGEGEEGGAAGAGGLGPEDEATVTAINALVQQLLREDEVPASGSGSAAAAAAAAAAASPLGGSLVEAGGGQQRASGGGGGRVDETGVESAARRLDELALSDARRSAALAEQQSINSAAKKALKYATVPLEVARERARRIATGEAHQGGEEEEALPSLQVRKGGEGE